MTSVLIAFGLALVGGILGLWKLWEARRDGKTEERLNHAEKVLDRTQKAKNAPSRLTDDMRNKLRERYGRK